MTTITSDELNTPYRYYESSVGPCWVVKHMSVVDEVPDLLASTLAIWLESELEHLAALPPAQRVLAAAKRRTALDEERALRREQPGRTVHGGAA